MVAISRWDLLMMKKTRSDFENAFCHLEMEKNDLKLLETLTLLQNRKIYE